jgi:hypothetical protein
MKSKLCCPQDLVFGIPETSVFGISKLLITLLYMMNAFTHMDWRNYETAEIHR